MCRGTSLHYHHMNKKTQALAVSGLMIALLVAILGLFLSDITKNPLAETKVTDPYVLATEGKTLVIRDKAITLEKPSRETLRIGDRIKTLADSTATVFWPDGSITRLGERSSIRINEMNVTSRAEKIQIDFALESGKTWSNVIHSLFSDSYFRERFNDDTALATVRGTVFEINLETGYVHAVDHAVSIDDTQAMVKNLVVSHNITIDTKNLAEIGSGILDQVWVNSNQQQDANYWNERMATLQSAIGASNSGTLAGVRNLVQSVILGVDLQKLVAGDPQELARFNATVAKNKDNPNMNADLVGMYQSLYSLAESGALLNTKMSLQDAILSTATGSEKQSYLDNFARAALYDGWKATENGSADTKKLLDQRLEEYIKQGVKDEWVQEIQKQNLNPKLKQINDTIEQAKQNIVDTVTKENLLDKAAGAVNVENLKKVNDAATNIREGIGNALQNAIH